MIPAGSIKSMGTRRLTLAEYVRRRNGVPLGRSGALRTMLRRSLGAVTFAGFWRYWNPVFGYVLGRYVYAPFRRFLPSALALILTFAVCGALHDLVAMAIRRSATFPFSFWFLFLAVGVLMGNAVGMDLTGKSWALRACSNLAYLGICLAISIAVRRLAGIP